MLESLRPHARRHLLGAVAVLGLLLTGAGPAFSADPPAPAAQAKPDPQEEIQRLRQEIERLQKSPDAPPEWRELMKTGEEFNRLQKQLSERIAKFSETPAAQQWHQRIRTLDQRLRELLGVEQDRTREAGRRLFEARQKDLAALAPADAPKARQLGLDVFSYPRVDGSTSTHPLAVLIACRCLGAQYEWFGRNSGGAFYPRGMSLGGRYYDGGAWWMGDSPEPEFYLLEYSQQARAPNPAPDRLTIIINRMLTTNAATHQAYVNLIEGRSDIGLLARPPSPDESKLAREKGVALDTVPCALDAFVFLVHEGNPVRNLTTAQIRDIYSGKVTNWKDVGGQDKKITAYQREPNSGSQELMQALVMKDLPLNGPESPLRPPQVIAQGMGGPYLALQGDKAGLAYSVYYYEHFMAGSAYTRVLAVDGVEPTAETIRTRKYPYTAEVLVVTRTGLDPATPTARWRAWLLSAEGQAVVRESGYVPITAAGL